MSSLWLDLRYALRMMGRTPALTAVLVVTLALGIGASTTIFSVVNSVVLRPLPYHEPDQLVRIYNDFTRLKLEKYSVSPPEYFDFQRGCRTCAAVGAWTRSPVSLGGGDRPIRVDAAWSTHTLLPLLGVQPMLGRWFDASEDRPGVDPTVVILGHDLWQRAFGGNPALIGRRITLDAMPVTVIGVMPPGFDFLDRVEAWVPFGVLVAGRGRGSHLLNVVARLAPGATLEAIRAEIDALMAAWARDKDLQSHHVDSRIPDRPVIHHYLRAEPFHADLVGSLSTTLWLLQGAVLFVLLIAIVNVANLLLARSETRTREVAVRHALGASRRRLVRQFITESLILGLVGGALGVLVATWAVDGITALIPRSAPRAGEITLDSTAVVFAVACSVGAALLFGLAPIVHARRSDLHGALKDGSPRMTGSRARLRVRRALVISEIALAVVLVIGCTVMVRSFVKLQQVELGMKPDHLLSLELELPEKVYPGTTGDVFWQRLQDRLRGLPGVTAMTLLSGLPPSRRLNANDFVFPGRVRLPLEPAWNADFWQIAGADALDTLGARLVKGRALLPSDTLEAPKVVLVNEAFAAKFLPGRDPIGQKIWVNNSDKYPEATIVGVVADIKQAGIDRPAGTEVFIPIAQAASHSAPERSRWTSRSTMSALLRSQGDPAELAPAVQRAIAELDPTLPVSRLRTMDDVMWEAVARPRFLTFLLTAFAGLALLLAAVGIYGVMAHTVAQRTHEIGLRVALGALPGQVRAMVLRQAGSLVAAGVGVGLAVAILLQLALDRSLRGLFYGQQLDQPVLLGVVALAVAATALLATWVPVRRATRVEPTVALRSE